jgi:hypothetical protein
MISFLSHLPLPFLSLPTSSIINTNTLFTGPSANRHTYETLQCQPPFTPLWHSQSSQFPRGSNQERKFLQLLGASLQTRFTRRSVKGIKVIFGVQEMPAPAVRILLQRIVSPDLLLHVTSHAISAIEYNCKFRDSVFLRDSCHKYVTKNYRPQSKKRINLLCLSDFVGDGRSTINI